MGIKEYDVFVIGTGTAGKMVAKACAQAGKNVAIADNKAFGGTCALRGCDPKKVLLGLSEILDRCKQMQGKGVKSLPAINWENLQSFKETFVDAVPMATEKDLRALGISMYHQSPYFLDEKSLSVEGKTVKAKKIIIATGNKPIQLDITGWDLTLNSDEFLNLDKLPESMLFVGAGYIGMEFAHLAASLGVKVTVIEGTERPLSRFDKDLVTSLVKAMEANGVRFIFNANVYKIEKLRKYFRVSAKQHDKEIEEKTEMVINTAGRIPSIDELNLDQGNVAYSKKGVAVNTHLQNTGNKNVYACGDVADSSGLPLTPLSSFEAELVIDQLLKNKKSSQIDYPNQPSVVFTHPQIAMVGLTEEEAKEKNLSFSVKCKTQLDWYNAKRENQAFYGFKTLVDKKTNQILGAHIIGPQAAEMINLFTLAMNLKLDTQALKKMVFSYPSWGNDIKSMI